MNDYIVQAAYPQTDTLYCKHLSGNDVKTLAFQSFTPTNTQGRAVVSYFKKYALSDETEHLTNTYLVKDKRTQDIVSFFSLKAGFVSANERIYTVNLEDGTSTTKSEFDAIPGVEIVNFAVNRAYKEKHPEVAHFGRSILPVFIKPIARAAQQVIGIKFLYIYALPEPALIEYYKKLHFQRLSPEQETLVHDRIKPAYDQSCIFMYQSL